jgi:hypothetical protein
MGRSELLIVLAVAASVFVLVQAAPLVHPTLIVVVLVSVFVWANPLFTVIEYRLTDSALDVTIFRLVRLGRVPYAEILEVRRTRWPELFARDLRWAESLGSSIFRPLVLIRRRSGRRRCVIITPAETDTFVAALQARAAEAGGSSPPPAAP